MSAKITTSLLAGLLLTGISYSQFADNVLNFDGVDDYVNLDVLQQTMYNNRNAFTVEFWMKATTADQTSSIRTAMFAINEPTNENRFHLILGGPVNQDGKLMVYGDGGSGAGSLYTSDIVIGDGNCHHIAYSFDGTYGRVYIDGALVDTHQTAYGITENDRYSLGQEYDQLQTSQFYNGDLDEVRIWGVARTTQEIQTNMNLQLNGTEADLLVYYDCNQGIPGGTNTSITTLDDITAANLDGTLQTFLLNNGMSNWIRKSCDSTNSMNEAFTHAIAVFPNPVNDLCTITADNLNKADVTVFNVLHEKIAAHTKVTLPLSVNFTDFPAGIYFIQIATGEGEYVAKVVVE